MSDLTEKEFGKVQEAFVGITAMFPEIERILNQVNESRNAIEETGKALHEIKSSSVSLNEMSKTIKDLTDENEKGLGMLVSCNCETKNSFNDIKKLIYNIKDILSTINFLGVNIRINAAKLKGNLNGKIAGITLEGYGGGFDVIAEETMELVGKVNMLLTKISEDSKIMAEKLAENEKMTTNIAGNFLTTKNMLEKSDKSIEETSASIVEIGASVDQEIKSMNYVEESVTIVSEIAKDLDNSKVYFDKMIEDTEIKFSSKKLEPLSVA